MAEGIDGQANDLRLTELEQRHISELHELAAAAGVPRFRTLRRAELAAAINAALEREAAPAQTRPAAPVRRRKPAPVQVSEPAPAQAHEPARAVDSVFAIIRVARGSRWTPGPKPEQVSVEKIVSSKDEADREVGRLTALAQSDQSGATYFWREASVT